MKITEALATEHTIFLTVFDQVERVLPGLKTAAEVRTVASLVEGLLQDHADTETSLAYLATDHVLQERGELTHMHQDHQEIDNHLRQAQAAESCVDAARLLRMALAASRQHFLHEERSVFPFLERVLQNETLSELGRAWSQRHARRTVVV